MNYLYSCPVTDVFSSLPGGHWSIMDVEFDPDRCAELHNQLFAKTLEHIPGAVEQVERNMIARVREEIPEEATWLLEVDEEYADLFSPEDLPFYQFFSQINTYKASEMFPLSGEFMQPVPRWFYSKYYADEDDERNIILLYPDYVEETSMDGGLFLDLDTWRVTWERLDMCRGLPRDEEAWVPLELALRKSLDVWERGKYEWSEPGRYARINIRSWTPRDLNEAVGKWENLLEEIQARLPPDSNSPRKAALQDPLPAQLVDQFQISPFAKAFLKTARRPHFALVAPGLTTFTEDSFRTLMGSENPDAPRRKCIADIGLEPDEYPSLIIPALATSSIPMNPPPPGDPSFDKGHGWGKFTVSRTAGLYTALGQHDGDSSMLVTAEGASQAVIEFTFRRPWGIDRTPTFAEMFDLWARYVREGVWDVRADGVQTPHSWFTDPATKSERELHWEEDLR